MSFAIFEKFKKHEKARHKNRPLASTDPSMGIGKRAQVKIVCREVWGFKSLAPTKNGGVEASLLLSDITIVDLEIEGDLGKNIR